MPEGTPALLGEPSQLGRPYLALNMVVTLDGRAAVGGTAQGIGSDHDRRLMRELRAQADVVLHGAGTVRADRLSPRVPEHLSRERVQAGLPPQPLGAIVTASGKLPAEHPYYRSATRIYVTSDALLAIDNPNVQVVRVGAVEDVVRDLARSGARRILCEGGPTLNAALLDAGIVDEVFVTIAPRLVGGSHPLTLVDGGSFHAIRLELGSVDVVEGELFLRYRVLA